MDYTDRPTTERTGSTGSATGTSTPAGDIGATGTAPGTRRWDTADLVAELNDLLQLDHDAIAAYELAIRELDSPHLSGDLVRHLADHRRHIAELGSHIEDLGGLKMPMPHASGVFKLAVQAAVAAASDRTVLLAFKANELQSRDKYARAAAKEFPPAIADTVRRAADDERRHYDWAVHSLEALGAATDDADVRATRAFAHAHARAADTIESAERGAMRLIEKGHRTVRRNPVGAAITAGLAVLGAGVLIKRVIDRD